MDANAWKRLEEIAARLRDEIARDSGSVATMTLLAEANACDSRISLWVLRLRSGTARLCMRAVSGAAPAAVRQLCDLVEIVDRGEMVVTKDRGNVGGSGFGPYEDIPMIVDQDESPSLWERLISVSFAV